jgi:LL-diaminopimelate aminotransferase
MGDRYAAARVRDLPAYLFAELDRKQAAARRAGRELISFGTGNPDLPTPEPVVDELVRAARDPTSHRYPDFYGLPEFRRAVADHYARRFGVGLDPDTQVLPLIGSKEGIAHLPWAVTDPGDPVLVCEPAYPVYEVGAQLAGARPVHVHLRAADDWFPDLGAIDPRLAAQARILWLCYPSNPTAAVATLDQLAEAVRFAARHRILLAYDNAYSELTYDGFVAPSVLQVPGADEVAVEFGTLSKTFNMTGWRLGWMVGNREAVAALGRLKTHLDSGVFNAVQRAGVAALDGGMPHLPGLVATYQRRRDLMVGAFRKLGWDLPSPRGAMYVWLSTPPGESSVGFASRLLDQAGVVVAPGTGYGPSGEGYVRLTLAIPDARIEAGCERVLGALAT